MVVWRWRSSLRLKRSNLIFYRGFRKTRIVYGGVAVVSYSYYWFPIESGGNNGSIRVPDRDYNIETW